MTWRDQYQEHELWETVTNALEKLAQVHPEDVSDDLGRLQALLADISGHAVQPHPALTSSHLTASIWVHHYNYHRPHTACADQPPASRVHAGVDNVMTSYN